MRATKTWWLLGLAISGILIVGCDATQTKTLIYDNTVDQGDIENNEKPVIHETVHYPGGMVDRRGNLLISTATVPVAGAGPVEVAKAKRAAYVVATRNAGWYLAGVRVGEDGRLRTAENRRAARVSLRGTRERESSYDKSAQRVTAVVEVEFREDLPGQAP